jgi:hypothetical protein
MRGAVVGCKLVQRMYCLLFVLVRLRNLKSKFTDNPHPLIQLSTSLPITPQNINLQLFNFFSTDAPVTFKLLYMNRKNGIQLYTLPKQTDSHYHYLRNSTKKYSQNYHHIHLILKTLRRKHGLPLHSIVP